MPECVIFIFRRDLRFNDNIGLSAAYEYSVKNSMNLMCIFIFQGDQIVPERNAYYSRNSVRFMVQCIRRDLLPNVRLFYTDDSDVSVLQAIHTNEAIGAVFFNRDYSPYARNRDDRIASWCKGKNIHVHGEWGEYSLIDILAMDKPYKVFGAFANKYISSNRVPLPNNNEKLIVQRLKQAVSMKMPGDKSLLVLPSKLSHFYQNKENKEQHCEGGRKFALQILDRIKNGGMGSYGSTRDYPWLEHGTTGISAYLKYGCVSIRELHQAIVAKQSGQTLLRELYWRTFYEQQSFWYPHVLQGQLSNKHEPRNNLALNPKNDSVKWGTDVRNAKKIMRGTTGIPIVDAAVRCLIKTGYMHNRLRMIVCMLAVRVLKMDWRLFEQWFATHLIDYYPCVNRLSWEWAATYRFVLNPWTQQSKFDKDCVFIKKWIPKMRPLSNKQIHSWYNPDSQFVHHPKPIINRDMSLNHAT